MEAAQAISLVAQWIRSRGLDHPTEGLSADRFEMGWTVFAADTADPSDPLAFLDLPPGSPVFLVGQSGRIEQVPSDRLREHEMRFAAEERADGHVPPPQPPQEPETPQPPPTPAQEQAFMEEFRQAFLDAQGDGPPAVQSFEIAGTPPPNDDALAAEASRLLEPIVQQLALLGPGGWEWFAAEFSFTVSAEIALLRFFAGNQHRDVFVPEEITAMLRRQRHVAAQMSAGPWWRLVLSVLNSGQLSITYDYGDEPFPQHQLLPPEHYRNDLQTYRRSRVPDWLTRYAGQ
ncbi:hypothetical protein [Amycolatopsis sp. NPDC051903]|uniref:hypothetical protein n=1 Tax=Amycolatopsis sp. NPDC051903 TaxID=3363936 RepID=UPI0037B53E18